MNNEIKEILEDFKWYINQPNNQDINGEYEYPRELTQSEAKLLLDYITNLQEENKELEEDKNKMFETAVKRNNQLLDRIDKAIEYLDFMIKHYKEQLDTPIDDTYFINDDLRKAYILSIKAYLQVLLDILQGSEKE